MVGFWKLSHRNRPSRNRATQGSYAKISIHAQLSHPRAYLRKLMPIKIVSIVKLEDEDIIDPRRCPDSAIQAKQKEQG